MHTEETPKLWATALGFALILFVALAPETDAASQRRRRKSTGKVRLVYFEGSLDEARRQSRDRNIPVVIHAVLDGEEAGDRYRDGVLPDSELRRACQNVITICANDGVHGTKVLRETVDGKEQERTVCEVYETSNCSAHQKNWNLLYHEFRDEESGDWSLPMTIVLDPESEIAFRNPEAGEPAAASSITRTLQKLRKKYGPGLTKKQLLDVRNALERSEIHLNAGNLGDAYRRLETVSSFATHGLYGEKLKKAVVATEKRMLAKLDELEEGLVPGRAAAAFGELLDMVPEWSGLPLEKSLAKLIKDAQRTKEIRDEIRAYKVEREAEDLWREAQGFEREKQPKKAERVIKRLLRSKYRGTPAAARAREAYPELARAVDEKSK